MAEQIIFGLSVRVSLNGNISVKYTLLAVVKLDIILKCLRK